MLIQHNYNNYVAGLLSHDIVTLHPQRCELLPCIFRWCSRDLAPLVNNQPAKGYGATEIDQEYHLTMRDL